MDVLLRALGVAVTGGLMALAIKRSAPELSLVISALAAITAGAMALQIGEDIAELYSLARDASNLSAAVVAPVVKCVGIGIVTRLGADVCKDAGQGAAASAVELVGSAAAISAALPLFRSLLSMIERFT
jgi:stage III sporulation protein AD